MSDLLTLPVAMRRSLAHKQTRLVAAWRKNHDNQALLAGRAALVDSLLHKLWKSLAMPADCALLAVGGYGRGELYPASDIDLLILLPDAPEPTVTQQLETKISEFIGLLWDIGLDIGHSVRTVKECLTEAERDITVQTALLEARYLIGSAGLYKAFA